MPVSVSGAVDRFEVVPFRVQTRGVTASINLNNVKESEKSKIPFQVLLIIRRLQWL
jgi:hypothetical protein